jgi:hypothetical protein
MNSFKNDIDNVILQGKSNPADDEHRMMIKQCSEYGTDFRTAGQGPVVSGNVKKN